MDADFLQFSFTPDFLKRYQNGVITKKGWTVRFTDSEVLFFGLRSFSIPNLTLNHIEACKKIVLGVKLEHLLEYLSSAELAEMISYLDRENLIRPIYQNEFIGTAWEKQVEFFSDFVDDPNAAQQRLLETSVCVIGCGGTGSNVIQHLVAAGIGKFILIDDDRVEKGNFNRQFCFDDNDLDTHKTEAISAYILARNSKAKVQTFCQQITSSADLDELLVGEYKPDIIFGCADTPPVAIHTFILNYCIKNQVFCTFTGLGFHHGHIGPLLTEVSRMEQCLAHKQRQLEFINTLTSVQSGTGIPSGSISYMAATIASLVAGDAIDLFAGIKTPSSLNTTWRYDPSSKSVIREQQY